ncbi:SDR family oxidoreductase [Mesorhizobium sp. NBSH29]|uniref:SDR family NAD(P)-dependent oxidoreductase n=1 Tax=Mesorhizobium sp. NBSH29 TaxID=2654249 RepID=UPI0018965F18|nr:SDR family oxidoreductase [Mesorhizobium sp. NBSH29]QPC85747.1 SDR family oxidoreductase [Mesorhizobium sp. NBSH29]
MSRKIAVITGAAGGMGRAIARALSQSGHDIVGLDVNEAGLAELGALLDPQAEFQPLTCDLTDASAIENAFAAIDQRFGAVDVLVNNAGTCFMSDFPNIPASEFDLQMSINFSSAFHCCQQAVQRMLKRDGVKKIINISSNGAYNFDVFDPPHYRASKAALDNLTKDLARRFARDKISVNSIAPAMTETPLFNVLTAEVLNKAISAMPHGRAMQPQEVAAWVAFLASPAGDIASGNVIILNQGRDVR